jgi:hypothetical protein
VHAARPQQYRKRKRPGWDRALLFRPSRSWRDYR